MNPADLTLAISPTLTSKTLNTTPTSALLKNGKAPVPRVDLEPIYTQLKSALGDHWTEYKTALNAFVLGNLNQAELNWVLQPLLSPAPSVVIPSNNNAAGIISTVQLHNSLIACLFANIQRDPPPSDVAPWVVATDKPTSASKNAGAVGANDKAEERLKREVMALQARDRRRIKTLKLEQTISKPDDSPLRDMIDYKAELSVKAPEITPQTAGGLAKTNWDLEIRRKYAQPLAAETLEFPSHADVQLRIEPICYEEGLVGGVQGALQSVADLIEQAAEVYLKEMLDGLAAHARANAEGCIQTARFRRQLRKEEDDAERGLLQRNPAGLLPAEVEVHVSREPIGREDLRLAQELGDGFIRQDRFLSERILLERWPQEMKREGTGADGTMMVNGGFKKEGTVNVNGVGNEAKLGDDQDAMAIDDDEWAWQGGGMVEQDSLMHALDDILAF